MGALASRCIQEALRPPPGFGRGLSNWSLPPAACGVSVVRSGTPTVLRGVSGCVSTRSSAAFSSGLWASIHSHHWVREPSPFSLCLISWDLLSLACFGAYDVIAVCSHCWQSSAGTGPCTTSFPLVPFGPTKRPTDFRADYRISAHGLHFGAVIHFVAGLPRWLIPR